MSDVIVMPTMMDAQEQAWHTLLDLHQQLPEHWTVVGGQMVHLWCAARGKFIARPTDDGDAVLDVRLKKTILWEFTAALKDQGFEPETASNGTQHRWTKDDAVIDVLIPRHLGPHSEKLKGVGGGTTIQTPGAQKVMNRTEVVQVRIGDRTGTVPRPSLLGAIVGKSAAYTVELDRKRDRHLGDLVVLATLLAPSDVDGHRLLDKRELRLVSNAVGNARSKPGTWSYVDGGADGLDRLAGVLNETRHLRDLHGKQWTKTAVYGGQQNIATEPGKDAPTRPDTWGRGNTRGKTTAKSNRGSFAPQQHCKPENSIG